MSRAERSRKGKPVARLVPGLWFGVFCSLTLELPEFSVFPFRVKTQKNPARAVGSPFPFPVSLFVPIIFPGNGDLWGSYGRGLPTLSNVTFQVKKKKQLFNVKRQSPESFNRVTSL